MTDKQRAEYTESKECQFAITDKQETARFRVSAFVQRDCPGMILRRIETHIPKIEDLKLPKVIEDLAMTKRGIIIFVGATGTGKSTSLASMIGHRNRHSQGHIITIEDPIEFVHQHAGCIVTQREVGIDTASFDVALILTIEDPIEFVHQSKKCLVNQREVHRDTHGFNEALRSALREDPDIILVGEMRDLETIRLALTAAETGHLVFGTLHTTSAAKTIDRVIDVFPAEEKSMVRSMLSESLQAVISQTLLKKTAGGRIAAHEIMIGIPAIRNLIRENKIAQMYSAIQTGAGYGMTTLDQTLKGLVMKGLVSPQVAKTVANQPDSFL
jgi:twitching motility protein PilT